MQPLEGRGGAKTPEQVVADILPFEVDPALARRALAEVPFWFHTFALNRAEGIYTPGVAVDHRYRLPFLPASFATLRVLDVGTFDGFYAFVAEARGARRVVESRGIPHARLGTVPDSTSMDDEPQQVVSGWRRGLRCSPFVVVAFCFFLPFFSVSSCDTGPQVTATGVGIVVGANPDVEQTGHTAPHAGRFESEARSIQHAARPWTTAALILMIVGIVLMVRVGRLYRVTSLAIPAAAFGAVLKIWGAVDVPSGDATPDDGLLLASVVLFLTMVWQACALTFLVVRSALNPRMNAEWEAHSRRAEHESSRGS